MKLKELTKENAVFPARKEFLPLQKKKGWALCFKGRFVYAFLRMIGKKPRTFYGLCPGFVIGKNWGGFSCGYFFCVNEEASESMIAHELGHAVQNANVGGLRVAGYCALSSLRYWFFRLRKAFGGKNPPYEAWWFEKQATELGKEYQKRLRRPD